jgi:hypothetical protein
MFKYKSYFKFSNLVLENPIRAWAHKLQTTQHVAPEIDQKLVYFHMNMRMVSKIQRYANLVSSRYLH